MSAESFKAAVEDLIAKVVGGTPLDAFDRYYAEEVTMQENEQPPRVVRLLVGLLKRTFFLKLRRCGPMFAMDT